MKIGVCAQILGDSLWDNWQKQGLPLAPAGRAVGKTLRYPNTAQES
jgi:hypothetical protein